MREKVLAIFTIIVLLALFVTTAIGFYFGAKGLYIAYLYNKYPLKYAETINKYASQYQLDPSLVAAVIYEESRFNPDSNSHKGAIGLMQILPDTGAYIAGKLGAEDFTEDLLTDIDINIRFGCYYLSYLGERFEGVDNVLAAYNAGEGNVDDWIKNESAVQFQETRNFIKRVNLSQGFYKRLYFTNR